MDERELKEKYRTIKLSNLRRGRGKFAHKHVVDVFCKCGAKLVCATSDLFQRRCAMRRENQSQQKAKVAMTIERLAELVTDFEQWAGGLPESPGQITQWLEKFAPSLSADERREIIQQLEQKRKP